MSLALLGSFSVMFIFTNMADAMSNKYPGIQCENLETQSRNGELETLLDHALGEYKSNHALE